VPSCAPRGIGLRSTGPGRRRLCDERRRRRISLRFRRLSSRRACLGRLDGWFARVKTTALRHTYFTVEFRVDGRPVDQTFGTRSEGAGVDLLHLTRGRHRLKVRVSRTYSFQRC
jgi:hypothetical protein